MDRHVRAATLIAALVITILSICVVLRVSRSMLALEEIHAIDG